MIELLVLGVAVVLLVGALFRVYDVAEHEVGLRIAGNRLKGAKQPGTYLRFAPRTRIELIDTRRQVTTVPGQELLTTDGISTKISLIVEYRVTDAVKAHFGVKDMRTFLYVSAQLAVRDVVSERNFEDVLSQRGQFGPELLARLQPQCEDFGVEAIRLEIKDVMLPGDLKKSFSQVAQAKYEAIAALERARGEAAVLRNLANAAKVLEGNPQLSQLKLLDIMANGSGNTFVVGDGTYKQ